MKAAGGPKVSNVGGREGCSSTIGNSCLNSVQTTPRVRGQKTFEAIELDAEYDLGDRRRYEID
jgi:hypothetical protein